MSGNNYIESREDVRENILELYSYFDTDNAEWAIGRLSQGRNFVVEVIGGAIYFAPSRFVGYKHNSKEKHEEDHGDGTQTDDELRKLYRKIAQGSELDKYFIEILKKYGKTKSSWKFWIPKDMTIEEVIASISKEHNTITAHTMNKYTEYINLLKRNRNLILNGAPGTGKTYLAKQIAAQIIFDGNVPENFEEHPQFIEQCGFVQFHPSYDYTDFVEGLRPTPPNKDGNIGFERKDGILKAFCKNALTNEVFPSYKMPFYNFKKDLEEKGAIEIKSFRSDTLIHVSLNEKGLLSVTNPQNPWPCSDEKMLKYLSTRECHQNDTYTKTIGDYILENYFKDKFRINIYIFIIDEINRGEISKIFGELFFSIDPGYRGKKGKVQTQYQNLIIEGDSFKDGFYIPENVYIIGTMNDIDRSVECMDFAMRRRFTFKEITAEESAKNMELSNEATERMVSLNNAISEIEGLNSSFHIGAAYFKDEEDYDALWNLKLEGLLREYLRGMPDAEESLETLRKAYYLDKE